MILRRRGGGDEAYVIYAIMAQITGKGNIYFFIVPPSGGTPVTFFFLENVTQGGTLIKTDLFLTVICAIMAKITYASSPPPSRLNIIFDLEFV